MGDKDIDMRRGARNKSEVRNSKYETNAKFQIKKRKYENGAMGDWQ